MQLIIKTYIFFSILFAYYFISNSTNQCFALIDDDYTLQVVGTFCNMGKVDTLKPTITNLSPEILKVTKVTITNDNNDVVVNLNDFTILDTNFTLDISGTTDSKKEIRIIFTPSNDYGNAEFFINIETSSLKNQKSKTSIFTSKANSLYSNSEDWGKRQVDPNIYIKKGGVYPFSPYSSEHKAITLRNDGTLTVTLSVPTIILDNNGSDFGIEVDDEIRPLADPQTLFTAFSGLTLKPSEEKTFLVYFHPKKECLSELKIQFNSDAVTPPVSTLIGNGAFPKSETVNHDCGTRLVGTNYTNIEVRFANTEWSCDYPLTIYDFRTEVKGATKFGKVGSKDIFRWDNVNIINQNGKPVTLPVTLNKGEYISIKGEFEPISDEYYEGSLITVSDAEEEAVSIWKGYGTITDGLKDESNKKSELRINPNPARDYLEISSINPTVNRRVDMGLDIQIFDVMGVVVTNSKGNPTLTLPEGEGVRIDVSFLAPGVYFLKIGNKVEKFVKI